MAAGENKSETPAILPMLLAEGVGTFALLFAGCGSIVLNAVSDGAISHVGISLVFGLVIMAMIYATGHLSGAHFNPAVTIAFAASGRFPWKRVGAYVLAQLGAAALALLALGAILGFDLGDAAAVNWGSTIPSTTQSAALGMEIVLSFGLMFVIMAVATDSRVTGELAGVAIGGYVVLAALFAGPFCGASMNPARSFGPAVLSGQWGVLWLYFVGPIVGTVLGALAYQWIRNAQFEGHGD